MQKGDDDVKDHPLNSNTKESGGKRMFDGSSTLNQLFDICGDEQKQLKGPLEMSIIDVMILV